MTIQQSRIAVVGAGMSGLVCAYELQKAGHEVVVYERSDSPGGRAATIQCDGYPIDVGAQFYNNGYAHARRYCQELGIDAQWKPLVHSTHHVYCRGKLYNASYRSVQEFLTMNMYSFLGRLRLLACYLRLRWESRQIPLYELGLQPRDSDAISVRDWVVRWGGKEVYDLGIQSMVGTYHFHDASELSLTCLLGAIGAIGEGFSYDYLLNGLGELPRALAERVGPRYGTPVQAVESSPFGPSVHTASGSESFDYVVLAVPAPVARRILKSPKGPQAKVLNEASYASSVVATFRVPRAPLAPYAMVAAPPTQSPHICCYMNQESKYPLPKDATHTFVNVFLRDESAQKALEWDDEALWRLMEREFITVCPPLRGLGKQVGRVALHRWPEAIPKYTCKYLPVARRFWHEGQGLGAIYLCGDYLNAPWVEGSVRCGERVAARMLQAQSRLQPVLAN